MASKNSTELIFSQQAFDKLLTVLDNVEKKINSVQKVTADLKKNSTQVTFKFNGLDSLDTFLDKVSRAKVNMFLDLVGGFQKLVGIGAQTATFGAFVKELNTVTGANLQPLVKTLKDLSGAVTDKEAVQLLNLGKALRGFAIAGEKDATDSVVKFIGGLATALKELSFLSAETIDTAAKNLSRFGNGLKNLVKTMQGVDNSIGKNNTALRIGTFFSELSIALKLVVKLQDVLGDGKAIRELSLTIERLGLGVAGLTKNLDSINTKSTTKLIAFLAAMAVAIRIVTKISGDAKKTQAVASLFTGLANLIKVAMTGFDEKNLSNNAKTFTAFQNRIKAVINVVKSIKDIQFKDSIGVSAVITAVSTLFEVLSKLSSGGSDGISPQSISTLKDFIKALRGLSDIKVSDSVAKSLEGVGKIFENFEKAGSVQQSATKFGGGLSNSVALGFIKGTLVVELGKFLFKVFAELNPVTLTLKFVTGVITVFSELKQKIGDLLVAGINRIKEVGTELSTFGTNLENLFGVSGILNSTGFQVAATFDDLANKSRVIGNLSEDSLKQVLAVADAVGQKYPVSANQALQAIINLQKAGINAVPDIEAVIAPIADLAALSDSGSIDAASQTVIQVVSSFKELADGVTSSYENAAVAADILSRGADNSTASVESLSAGLANVGPTAASFGLNLEDTVAILSLFEDRGIKGAEAGTQLKSVLTNLTRPTDAVKNELKKLGIQLTDSKGNFRDMNDIINQFNDAFNNTTKVVTYSSKVTGDNKKELDLATKAYAAAQRAIFQYQNGLTTGSLDQKKANDKIAEYQMVLNNASNTITKLTGNQQDAAKITTEITRTQQQNFESIQKVFGTYGQAGAAILTSLGDDAIKNFTDQMGRLPTAAEKAQLSMQSFNGQVEQLRGSTETLLKNFFLPMIQTIFEPFVRGMLAITNAVLRLDPEIIAITSTAVAFGAILASIVAAVSGAIGFFVTLGGAVLSLGTVFFSYGSFIVATISGFAVGLVAFVAAAIPVIAVLGSLAAGFRFVLTTISNNIGGSGDALRQLGERVKVLLTYFTKVADSLAKFLTLIFGGGASQESVNSAGVAFTKFFDGITTKVNQTIRFFSELNTALVSFLDFFNNGINPTKSGLDALERLSSNPFISFLLDKTGLEHSATGVNELFRNVADGIKKMAASFGTVTSGIGDLFSSFNDPKLFAQGKQKIITGFSQLGSTLANAVQTLFGVDLTKAIADFDAGNLAAGLKDILIKGLQGLQSLIVANRGTIKDILLKAISLLFNPLNIPIKILDFLGLSDVSGVLKQVQSAINQIFGGTIDTLINLVAGQDIKTALVGGFGAGIEPIIKFAETLGEVIGTVIDTVKVLLSALFPVGNSAQQSNLLTIVTGVFDFLTSSLLFLNDNILKPLKSIISSINLDGLTKFITNLFNQFVSFFSTFLSGDINGAIKKITGLGSSIFEILKSLIAKIFEPQQFNIQDKAVSEQIGNGIFSLIGQGLQLAIGFLSGLNLPELATELLKGIVNTLSSFLGNNPEDFFSSVAETIVGAIGSAVTLAFVTLGQILGFDTGAGQQLLQEGFAGLVEGINNFFTGGTAGGDDGIFSDIIRIFEKVGKTIKKVVDFITPLIIPAIQTVLEQLFNLLSRVANIVLTGIGESLTNLEAFFDKISQLDPTQLVLLGGGILAIVAALLPLIAPGLVASISAAFGSIVGFLTSASGLILGILVVKNIGQNLSILADIFTRLVTLDISGAADSIINFFGRIASGVVFDILKLFGIDSINGVTADTVNEKIRQVADFVKQKLDELATTLSTISGSAAPIIDFFKNGLAGALQVLGFIASLVMIPIQIVQAAILKLTSLSEKEKRGLVEFLIAVGAALLIANFSAIAIGVGLLAASFLSLAAGALVAVTTVGAILVLLVVLKSAVDNIDKLFSVFIDIFSILDDIAHLQFGQLLADLGLLIGDIIDFVGNTLTDAFFTIAGFFGFDKVLGKTKDDIKTTISQIVYLVKSAYQVAAVLTAKFFRDTFNDLSNKIAIAAADVRLAVEDATARARTIGQDPSQDKFFKTQALFDPKNFSLKGLSEALTSSEIDQTALRDFAIKNAGLIKDALTQQLQNGDQSSGGLYQIQTGIQFSIASNNISQVIDQVFSLQGDEGKKAQETFMKSISYALSTGSLSSQEASGIIRNIFDEVSLGVLDPSTAQKMLETLDLSNAQLSADQKAALQKQIDDGIKAAATAAKEKAENNPVPIDPSKIVTIGAAGSTGEGNATKDADLTLSPTVSIEPTVVPTTEDKKNKFFADVQKVLDDQSANTTTKITPDVPVAPVFTGITNQEDVTKFQGQIDTLNKGLDTSNSKFSEFAGAVNDNVTNMQLLADAVAQDSTDMQANFDATLLSFNSFKDGLVRGYNDIAGSIARVTIAMSLMMITSTLIIPTITNNIATLKNIFNEMSLVATTAFDNAILAVTKLDNSINSLIADIDTAITKAGALSGIDVAGKREKGGPVWKGLFEVGEQTKPELLFQNGRMYLISPTGGQVEPMQPIGDTSGVRSGFGLEQPIARPPTGGIGSQNVTNFTVQEGDINLNISGGNVSPDTINSIRTVIRQELDNKNKSVEERLRSAGKA